jgi:hypothetical protein
MDSNNNKKGLANLTKKAAAVFGAALAALTGVDTNSTMTPQNDNVESNTIQVKEIGKVKPMPILKLNMDNPENSLFVSQHRSHYSHSSHSSHSSHYSHYSHRSGAMFS